MLYSIFTSVYVKIVGISAVLLPLVDKCTFNQ
jgi:hypothetical protein